MVRFGSLLAAAVLALAGHEAVAQSNNPAWLDPLKAEIESELAGRRLYEARVQCADGRMFDASRQEPDPHFKFQACGVQVCQNDQRAGASPGGRS